MISFPRRTNCSTLLNCFNVMIIGTYSIEKAVYSFGFRPVTVSSCHRASTPSSLNVRSTPSFTTAIVLTNRSIHLYSYLTSSLLMAPPKQYVFESYLCAVLNNLNLNLGLIKVTYKYDRITEDKDGNSGGSNNSNCRNCKDCTNCSNCDGMYFPVITYSPTPLTTR
jgi:hypothetical protein